MGMALAAATAAAPSTNITSFHLILRRHRLLLLVLMLHIFCLGVKTHSSTEQHDQVTDSIGQSRIIQPITGRCLFSLSNGDTRTAISPSYCAAPPIYFFHRTIKSAGEREKSLFFCEPPPTGSFFPFGFSWATGERSIVTPPTEAKRSLPFLVPSARLRTFLRTLTQEEEEEGGSDAAACCVGRMLEGREGKIERIEGA